jgi:dipeptidyl aminopeptidase/acylaminoacyl peptidase
MKRYLTCLTVVLCVAAPAHAQKRAFTLEDIYRIRSVGDVQVSPDGRRAAYTVITSDLPRGKRSTQIWLMDLATAQTRELTHGEASSSSPIFSPDGRSLAFVSSRDGDDNVYLLPLDAGEARALTHLSTGVSDPIWSPDGKSIAFASDIYPECKDEACNKRIAEMWHKGTLKAHLADSLLYRHWTSWKDGTRTHIFLLDVASGTVRDVTPGDFDSPTFQLGGPVQYAFAPDSSELCFVSNHDPQPATSTNNDLWLVSLTTPAAAPRNITSSNPAYDGSPVYSPDGRYIGYRTQRQPGYESDLFRLAVYDRRSATSSVLTESFRDWVTDFEWSADSTSITFHAEVQGQTPLYRLDVSTRAVVQVIADKTIDVWKPVPGTRQVVYARRGIAEAPEIFIADLAGRTASPRQLTHLNDAIAKEVDLRPAERIWVDGAAGAKIDVFIVKPHGFDPGRKYPLILNVHGGPQDQWRDAFRGDFQIYAGAGYVTAFANPHGSVGYGQDFTAQITGDWGGAVFEDLMKVTDSLARLPYVDANRLGAMGWSFGGYMMNWFEGHTDRFKAIASMMGVYDLRSMHGATEELWFPQWELKGRPWESPLYEKFSPSSSVRNFKTPALVITGERDYRVPYTQSLQFFTDLQEKKVPSRLIVYPNAGHWPSWYEMALYYTAHLEWFQKYLGGDPPPWTTEQFLRNAVFDKDGKRIPAAAPAPSIAAP